MAKEFLVLISFFIELSSGFIVPPGTAEASHNIRVRATNDSKENSSETNLENIAKIDEKELYQTNDDKANAIDERSFIYLKQTIRKPYFRQSYKTLMPNSLKPLKTYELHEKIPLLNAYQPEGARKILQEPIKQKLFFPNTKGEENPQFIPSLHRPQYSYHPAVHQHVQLKMSAKDFILMQEQSSVTKAKSELPEFYGKQSNVQSNNLKSDNKIDKQYNIFNDKVNSIKTGKKPSVKQDTGRITSYTHRKKVFTNNTRCGFPNHLHRKSFDEKNAEYNSNFVGKVFSPAFLEEPNFEPSLDNVYEDLDDAIQGYMKNTLGPIEQPDINEPLNNNNENSYKDTKLKNEDVVTNHYETISYSDQETMPEILKDDLEPNEPNRGSTKNGNSFYRVDLKRTYN